MSHGHASSPGQRSLATAVLVTCGILTLGWMVHQRYYSHHDPSPPIRATGGAFSANNGISIYLLQRTGVKNTQGQRRAHYVMLLAIAAVAGLAALRKPLVAWRCPDFLWPVLGTAAATAIAAFLIWSAKRQTYPGWYYAVGAAVAVLLGWFGSRWCAARRNRAFGMLAVLSLLVFCGPTLFMQLDHSYRSWQVVELMEAHYTALFSPADRLANGARPGDEVGVLYGMLMPLLVAVGERYVGDLSLRGHVILVNILQVAYLAAAAYGYYLYGRRRWFLALLPILLVGVHYHFYNEFLDRASPNHTAWRAIALPLSCLLLISFRRTNLPRASLILGGAAGIAIVLNPETGIACAAGMAAFLFFRHRTTCCPRPVLRGASLAARFTLGVALSLAIFAGCLLLFSGSLPSWVAIQVNVNAFRTFTSSCFSGGFGPLDPLAVLIYAHAAVSLLQSSFRNAHVGNGRSAVTGGIAATILVWFSYYANRPHPEYLISYHVLYGYLLVDLLRVLVRVRQRTALVWPALGAAGILTALVLPHFEATIRDELPLYRRGIQLIAHPPAPDTAAVLSGVYFPNGLRAQFVEKKAAYLRKASARGQVVYFTVDSYLIPKVSGVPSKIPVADAYWESRTSQEYERLLRCVVGSAADTIYFDSDESIAYPAEPSNPDAALPFPGMHDFYRRLRTDLSRHFQPAGVVDGWERWQRRVN